MQRHRRHFSTFYRSKIGPIPTQIPSTIVLCFNFCQSKCHLRFKNLLQRSFEILFFDSNQLQITRNAFDYQRCQMYNVKCDWEYRRHFWYFSGIFHLGICPRSGATVTSSQGFLEASSRIESNEVKAGKAVEVEEAAT